MTFYWFKESGPFTLPMVLSQVHLEFQRIKSLSIKDAFYQTNLNQKEVRAKFMQFEFISTKIMPYRKLSNHDF